MRGQSMSQRIPERDDRPAPGGGPALHELQFLGESLQTVFDRPRVVALERQRDFRRNRRRRDWWCYQSAVENRRFLQSLPVAFGIDQHQRQPKEFEASLFGFRERQLDLAGFPHDLLEPEAKQRGLELLRLTLM